MGWYANGSNVHKPLACHYDGANWTLVNPTAVGTGNNHLSRVVMIATNNVLSVGDNANTTSLETQSTTQTYNGSTWAFGTAQNPGVSGVAYPTFTLTAAVDANKDTFMSAELSGGAQGWSGAVVVQGNFKYPTAQSGAYSKRQRINIQIV